MAAVYLLTPVHQPGARTYIGKTTRSVETRLKEHNGVGGAKRTLKHRPWKIVCVIKGFEDAREALRFEWMWQHPYESRLTKHMLTTKVKGRKGVGGMYTVKRKLLELDLILQAYFPQLVVQTPDGTLFKFDRSTSFIS
jgi:structure-specific endonuclease subunit SLX1